MNATLGALYRPKIFKPNNSVQSEWLLAKSAILLIIDVNYQPYDVSFYESVKKRFSPKIKHIVDLNQLDSVFRGFFLAI